MNRISERVNIAACLGFTLLILLPIGRAKGASDNESKLLELAKKKFHTLTEAEMKLFRAVANGEVANYRIQDQNDNDPANADKWGHDRVLDANRIEWLSTDSHARELVTHRGIQLKGVRIEGNIDLEYAKISFPLIIEKSSIPQGMSLEHAQIPVLSLAGTHTGPIKAGEIKVVDRIFLWDSFRAKGEVRLLGGTIGGDLICMDGQFINPNGLALNADGLKVGGNLFLDDGFKAEGVVRMVGATIEGNLQCNKGRFINPNKDALVANGLKVKGAVHLCDGFSAQGMVGLASATIDGDFIYADVNSPDKVTLDLRSARIGILHDEEKSWPEKGNLLLHGLVYQKIDDGSPMDAKSRVDWLRRQPGFHPQPYEQLAAVLRKGGQDEDAREILIAKNEDRARLTKLTRSEKWWYRVLGPTIGYGYRPLNALWGVVAFVGLGWLLFGIGYWGGLVTPQSESAYVKTSVTTVDGGAETRELSDVYPRFNFLVYSLDVFVPLIDLHQAKYWLPNANRGLELLSIKGFSLHTGGILRLYLWIHITMGWAITMLLVAGLTGLIRT